LTQRIHPGETFEMSDETPISARDVETLDQAIRIFVKQRGVQELIAFAGVQWAVRATRGRPRLSDALVAAGVVAFWPFQEWAAHKWLLHLEPTEKRDPAFARAHRTHHQNPHEIKYILLPTEVIRAAMPGTWLASRILFPFNKRLRSTALATYATMAVAYEWSHFIVHTRVEPKSSYYARVRKNHLLHHFRNENYWFGFVSPAVDALLGTEPDPESVSRSKTATDLHGLAAKARELEAAQA
jgi:hypothetical protein